MIDIDSEGFSVEEQPDGSLQFICHDCGGSGIWSADSAPGELWKHLTEYHMVNDDNLQ